MLRAGGSWINDAKDPRFKRMNGFTILADQESRIFKDWFYFISFQVYGKVWIEEAVKAITPALSCLGAPNIN